MNEINAFDSLGIGQPTVDNSARTELGQEAFMTLMMAQFRNQDPFEPMDNGDFLGQLAQFGTVSGIDELNGAFSGLQSSIQSDQALQAANLVGRTVLAESDTGSVSNGGGVAGAVELPSSVSNVQIEITDASGQLVRRFDIGAQQAGVSRFNWDGLNDSGQQVSDGQYEIAARVQYGNEIESVPTLIEANIASVTLGRGGSGLTLNLAGGEQMSLARVRQIN